MPSFPCLSLAILDGEHKWPALPGLLMGSGSVVTYRGMQRNSVARKEVTEARGGVATTGIVLLQRWGGCLVLPCL